MNIVQTLPKGSPVTAIDPRTNTWKRGRVVEDLYQGGVPGFKIEFDNDAPGQVWWTPKASVHPA